MTMLYRFVIPNLFRDLITISTEMLKRVQHDIFGMTTV